MATLLCSTNGAWWASRYEDAAQQPAAHCPPMIDTTAALRVPNSVLVARGGGRCAGSSCRGSRAAGGALPRATGSYDS
eukprot:3988039-Prymnesium_polylepis.2